MSDADVHFYFDPVCPFAWMTSKWLRLVQAQRAYSVQWRFISLRLVNADVDYDARFPAGYEAGHTAGLRLLRVAARTRAELGHDAVATLYRAVGEALFETPPPPGGPVGGREHHGTAEFLGPVLQGAGLPEGLADALDDDSWDEALRTETDEALALTGKDVGTPIIHVRPPSGLAFFGPVISRLPEEADAAVLWDHVVALAGFPGFAELKRSLRERPQLPGLGVDVGAVGVTEDWHAGSRRRPGDPADGPAGDPTGEDLQHEESVVVRATPEAVYDLVSDVTRTGQWSPVCTACWWDEGAGPTVGSWFTGRNQTPERTWETRSQVVAADRGREFAFVVGGSYVRWGFRMEPVPEGTRLTESWHFLPDGIALFHTRYGEDAAAQIEDRTRHAHEGIPVTLAALRRIVEG